MRTLAQLLPEGIARREELTSRASSSSVHRWLRGGTLVQLQPGVVALPDRAGDWQILARAALLWSRGALSHLTALTVAGLATPRLPIHVTVPTARCPRGAAGVITHRSDRRQVTIRQDSLEALVPERSLVDAWVWAHTPGRNPSTAEELPVVRQALIDGVRAHALRLSAVRRESMLLGAHPGRAGLQEVLGLVAGGCQSELEIWGVLRVLPEPPQVPPRVQQHPVQLLNGQVVHLDAAYPEVMVGVELDGAAFHGSRAQRERDLRRDSALAALGWVVLRFSYARLMRDPGGCRREIVAAVLGRLAR